MEIGGLQQGLQRVVVCPADGCDRVDLPQIGIESIEGTPRLRGIRISVDPGRGLVDVEQLKLMGTLVANVTYLQDKLGAQFLLKIQVPALRVRSLKVVIDT